MFINLRFGSEIYPRIDFELVYIFSSLQLKTFRLNKLNLRLNGWYGVSIKRGRWR